MVRRAHTVTPRNYAPRSRALGLSALVVVAVAMFGGCIGGAQPVPPALESDPSVVADAGASDASRGSFSDGGPSASDAASPPPENDDLADFAGEHSATPNVVDRATDHGWRWYPFAPPAYFRDAGAPVADDLGPRDESVDAQ